MICQKLYVVSSPGGVVPVFLDQENICWWLGHTNIICHDRSIGLVLAEQATLDANAVECSCLPVQPSCEAYAHPHPRVRPSRRRQVHNVQL